MIEIAFFLRLAEKSAVFAFQIFFYYLCGESHFSGYLIAGSSLPDGWQGASLIFACCINVVSNFR